MELTESHFALALEHYCFVRKHHPFVPADAGTQLLVWPVSTLSGGFWPNLDLGVVADWLGISARGASHECILGSFPEEFWQFYRAILALLVGLGMIAGDFWLNWGVAPSRREDGLLLFGLLGVACGIFALCMRYCRIRRAQQSKRQSGQ
jgi:hypothetical protein